MIRLLSDENFRGRIVRGLLRRRPALDLVRVQDVGLLGREDPEVLAWAAAEGRILLSHDRATIPPIAFERLDAGEPMPGVFILENDFPTGPAIEHLLFLDECTDSSEWDGRVIHLPVD